MLLGTFSRKASVAVTALPLASEAVEPPELVMDRQTLGRRLREMREAAGLTQQQLADRSGVPQANIARYEQGVREPLATVIPLLAAALKVSANDLFADPKPSKPQPRGRPRKP
jgi:DNA-binding XRE family transcriptional regulator